MILYVGVRDLGCDQRRGCGKLLNVTAPTTNRGCLFRADHSEGLSIPFTIAFSSIKYNTFEVRYVRNTL
jgi:hypothetical protein